MEPETLPGGAAEARRERLFPDYADDLTLGEIVPRLSWKTIDSLASESPAWLQAVRSREVYDARAIYDALEPLVLIKCASKTPDDALDLNSIEDELPPSPNCEQGVPDDCQSVTLEGGTYALGEEGTSDATLDLYSTQDGFYFELPPLPNCEQRIPADCQIVTLDGRVYALGGKRLNYLLVYVLDLAGRREWKQCASMLRQKKAFGCAALDGKVYVIGIDLTDVQVLEVYDPTADTWSVIQGTAFRQSACSLTVVGEELFVLSLKSGFWVEGFDEVDPEDVTLKFACTADIYHPIKDEWRMEKFSPWNGEVETAESIDSSILFTAKGKLYRMMYGSIFCLDMDTKTWVTRHLYSLDGLIRLYRGDPRVPSLITDVGDELLASYGSTNLQVAPSK